MDDKNVHLCLTYTGHFQHQCLPSYRRRYPDYPRSARYGQADRRQQGLRDDFQRRRDHHEAARRRPPCGENSCRHRQESRRRSWRRNDVRCHSRRLN
jgi:hypothetical protein